MTDSYPILEFDPAREAIINPEPHHKSPRLPERAVGCFFHEVLAELEASGELRVVHHLRSELGPHPIYEMTVGSDTITVYLPGLCAPFSAAYLEDVIAHGCRKFIMCGGCGVLDGSIARGHLVVVTSAVRDEGTSYHYLAPGREVEPSESATQAIKQVLDDHDLPYLLGKTWTTDAFYRETKDKIRRRAAERCITVEMEAAAMFAVAQFRGVEIGQLLYGGDDVSGEVWDFRDWYGDTTCRERVFRLAVEAALRL